MDIIYGALVGEELDSEDICWPTQQAFIYVYNGCSQPVNVTVTVRHGVLYSACATLESCRTSHGLRSASRILLKSCLLQRQNRPPCRSPRCFDAPLSGADPALSPMIVFCLVACHRMLVVALPVCSALFPWRDPSHHHTTC